MRVLLVEDDMMVANAITRAVKRLGGIEVVHVSTVDSAREHLRLTPIDLVLSDYNLVGIQTGADVLAFSRELETPPRFLFISSDDAIKDLGVPFLEKPCTATAIRNAIIAMGIAAMEIA